MKAFAVLLLAAIFAVPFLALAQVVPPLPDSASIFAAFVAAIQAGQWPVVAVLIVVALVWFLRTFGQKWIPWLGTSEGGTVLAFLTALAATLGTAAIAGAPVTWGLVAGAFGVAFTAMGAWTGVRRLLRMLVPLAAKVPNVGPFLASVLTWLSGAESPPAPVG